MSAVSRTVLPEEEGKRLGRFALGAMGVSHRCLSSLKNADGVLVNGTPRHADYILHSGDVVTLEMPEDEGREDVVVVPEEGDAPVVWEDEYLLVIDKPAPLPCQCSCRQSGGTLENRLAWRYRDEPGFLFRPVNRLDKGTSGLMAAAKDRHVCQLMQARLHTEDYAREYVAIVEGRMEGEGVFDLPMRKEDGASIKRVVDFERGARAVTHYKVLQAGERYSLVRLRLETGRTHQIRVHLSYSGHPIAGDFLYGSELESLPGRFALHASRIRFRHPLTGELIERISPLPASLSALINAPTS